MFYTMLIISFYNYVNKHVTLLMEFTFIKTLSSELMLLMMINIMMNNLHNTLVKDQNTN